eukprot:Pgem_evm1s16521
MDWLRNEKKVSKFVKSFNLKQRLQENDGFVRIENFLPIKVALAVADSVVKLKNWELASGEDDV